MGFLRIETSFTLTKWIQFPRIRSKAKMWFSKSLVHYLIKILLLRDNLSQTKGSEGVGASDGDLFQNMNAELPLEV